VLGLILLVALAGARIAAILLGVTWVIGHLMLHIVLKVGVDRSCRRARPPTWRVRPARAVTAVPFA